MTSQTRHTAESMHRGLLRENGGRGCDGFHYAGETGRDGDGQCWHRPENMAGQSAFPLHFITLGKNEASLLIPRYEGLWGRGRYSVQTGTIDTVLKINPTRHCTGICSLSEAEGLSVWLPRKATKCKWSHDRLDLCITSSPEVRRPQQKRGLGKHECKGGRPWRHLCRASHRDRDGESNMT